MSLLHLLLLLFPAYISVESDQEVSPEGVLEQSGNITVYSGKDTSVRCAYKASKGLSVTCLWLWEYPQRNGAPTVVARFPGHGPTQTDCSINLVNVSHIQTGWWTCRAQPFNSSILHTDPVFLQVINSPEVIFEIKPTNRTLSVGTTTELECKAKTAVKSCQWMFQQEGQTEPIVVTDRTPTDNRTCSFKLELVSYEQAGMWKCGARTHLSDQFTYTPTVYIQVEHKEEAYPVEFLEEPSDTDVGLGQSGRLHCKVHDDAHIENCRWYWQPLSHSKAWKVLMREFLPENNDCSIEFNNITADPEGLWTCHVKPIHSDTFKDSRPAKLTVHGDASTSVLTRDISIYEGEPLSIFCIAEQPAKLCLWKRKGFDGYQDKVNQWLELQPFPSSGHELRDCSLHIDHVQLNHQGLWVCGMQFYDDHPFLETMPTALTVKVPNIVKFMETPRTQLAAEDFPVLLNCSALSGVRECFWTWYEDDTKVAERLIKFNFTRDKDNNYNCSMVIPKVDRSLQGIWQCGVKYGDPRNLRTSYASPFSLTVVKKGSIIFRTVQMEAYITKGRSGLLECVVREPVEECLWQYQEDLHSPSLEFSRFQPKDFNNCSLQISGNLSSGWWTCGARNIGDSNFTMARSFRMNILDSAGGIATMSKISPEDTLVLVCKLPQTVSSASCDWIHPSALSVFHFNITYKYTVKNNPDTGECSVTFSPMLVDVGHWKCVFSLKSTNQVVGEASFTVLSSPHNWRLSWIVGVLATVTLILTVLLFVIIACRFFQCHQSSKATMQVNRSLPETSKRYSEDPTKGINFSFNDNPELLVDFSIPSEDNHHYERVGRYGPHRPSFYQNVQ